MARPTLEDILSGTAGWDADINDNKDAVVNAPFPMIVETSLSNLNASYSPSLYDACWAGVWDGTPGNPVSLYTSNGSAWVSPSVGFSGKVLDTDNLFHIQHREASGVNGGGSTAATWNVRTLNTTLKNGISGASLGSNQITLPAGTYWIEIKSEANAPSVSTQLHQCKLENVSDSTTAVLGTSKTTASNTTDDAQTTSEGAEEVIIASTKTFELQHYTSQTLANTGLGTAASSGEQEMYATVKIWKTA